jgi:hypothetical protein
MSSALMRVIGFRKGYPMETLIKIECPPEMLNDLHMDAEAFSALMKLRTAITLFKEGGISSGMAARWLGIPRVHFLLTAMQDGCSLLEDSEEDFSTETALL